MVRSGLSTTPLVRAYDGGMTDDIVELNVTAGVPFTIKSGVHYRITMAIPEVYPDVEYVISGIERADQGFSPR